MPCCVRVSRCCRVSKCCGSLPKDDIDGKKLQDADEFERAEERSKPIAPDHSGDERGSGPEPATEDEEIARNMAEFRLLEESLAEQERQEQSGKREQEKLQQETTQRKEKPKQENAQRKNRGSVFVGHKVAEPKVTEAPIAEQEGLEDLNLQRAKLESLMLKEDELPLADVLPAKAAAIQAMSLAIEARNFEMAKQLKNLRDILAHEQTAMYARLARAREVHRMLSSRVDEAVGVENFDDAKELNEVQQLAEECVRGFALRENQGGSADLSSGCICLGSLSSLGLLEGDFTVECWVLSNDLAVQNTILSPAAGSFPSLSIQAGGCLEVRRLRYQSHASQVHFAERQCWTHVAFSWSHNASENRFEVNVFQDGSEVAFGTEYNAIEEDEELRLGPFPGKLAEFRIWDHARSQEEVELWMHRRCTGEEEGLRCCLSLQPGRLLADSTLDPGMTLEPGNHFADRGCCEGTIGWDGAQPLQLQSVSTWTAEESSRAALEAAAKTCSSCGALYADEALFCRQCGQQRPKEMEAKIGNAYTSEASLWADESLSRAWKWLESRHSGEAMQRKLESEIRREEDEQRQVEEKQRRAYAEWAEQLKRQAAEEKRKGDEDERRRQQIKEELERKKERRMRPFSNIMKWTCPMASFTKG